MLLLLNTLIGSGGSAVAAAEPVPNVESHEAAHAPVKGRRRPAGVTKIGRED